MPLSLVTTIVPAPRAGSGWTWTGYQSVGSSPTNVMRRYRPRYRYTAIALSRPMLTSTWFGSDMLIALA